MIAVGRFRRNFWPQVLLFVGALISTLTSHPGKMPADTKLYLYLDPSRLISDSVWSWDFRQFGGWVPHQNVGYLWPTGPFYWLLDAVELPDWIAQRLWLSLLLFVAGFGSFRFARNLGLSLGSAFVAGCAYQFSPYVLPYISRTSALLIPWSLLPWLVLIACRYGIHRRGRDLALFTLLIASSGGLNATALLVLAPGPLIWLLHVMSRRDESLRRRTAVILLLGSVAVAASAWWLVGLVIQGRFGASVLSYSEALESTSATSSAPEVLRGLGYWLFYDRGPAAPLTTASAPYQSSVALIALGSILIVVSLIGIGRSGQWRRPLSSMMFVGAIIAIGAHPFDSPSPLFRPLTDNPQNALSLALRSSTRAVPLVVLACAVGLGFAVSSLDRSRRPARLVHILATAAIMGNLPAAWNGDLVDRSLLRPQELPSAWQDAAKFLDSRYDEGFIGAVLLLPGIESAAYRWGYPVDAILPGISRKPLLTREWLPLGSPGMMDLLYALDDSFQNGTPATGAIAPVARMLGADTVMFVTSHQYERFGSVNPSRAADAFDPLPPGLTHLAQFGDPSPNESSLQSWSEEAVAHPVISLPEIVLYSVENPLPSARLQSTPIVLASDGTGLVDLSDSSDLQGLELTLAEASLDDSSIAEFAKAAAGVIVTDSNRRRAHHWRSSQEVWGATEPEIGILDGRDNFDSRLPIFEDVQQSSETIVEPAAIEATATGYGAELRYHPEYRPRSAVDGDLRTAWRLGPDRDPRGHILTLRSSTPLDSLRLVQPLDKGRMQWITRVSVSVDGSDWKSIALGEASLKEDGQPVPLNSEGHNVRIRIDDLNVDGRFLTSLGVGFAEVVDRPLTTPEVVRLPDRMSDGAASPLLYSLNRLRSDPFDRWREDPERSLIRRLPIPIDEVRRFDVEVRLDPRADDKVLAAELGITSATSVHRLNGTAAWWGPAAFDGESSTSWWGPSSSDTRSTGYGTLSVPVERPARWIEFVGPSEAARERSPASLPKEVRITFFLDGKLVDARTYEVAPPDRSGTIRLEIAGIESDRIDISFTAIDAAEVVDAFTGRTVAAPLSFSEIRSNGWRNGPLPKTFDTGCRSDLLFLDDRAIPIRIRGDVADALDGQPLVAELCPMSLLSIAAGSLIRSISTETSAWNVDRIRIGSDQLIVAPRAAELPLNRDARDKFSVRVPNCEISCTVDLPFGYSTGWQGALNGRSVGSPSSSASGRSIWHLDAGETPARFSASWSPQSLMWAGAIVSTSAVLASLVFFAIGCLTRRSRSRSRLLHDELADDIPSSSTVSRRRTTAILGGLAGILLIGPLWGVLAGFALWIVDHGVLRKLAVSCVAVGYLFVVLQQLRTGADPGFAWPSVFERAHHPLVASLLVFTFCHQAEIPPRSRPRAGVPFAPTQPG